MLHGRDYGCPVDAAGSAASPGPVLDQQHVRLLFQEVLLCGVHDASGRHSHTDLHSEKRREGHREYAVSCQQRNAAFSSVSLVSMREALEERA